MATARTDRGVMAVTVAAQRRWAVLAVVSAAQFQII